MTTVKQLKEAIQKGKPNIRAERLRRRMTLKELSKDLVDHGINITPDGIAKYERGDREPDIELWTKLANYFNVETTYLMGYDFATIDEATKEFKESLNKVTSSFQKMNHDKLTKQLQSMENADLSPFEENAIALSIEFVLNMLNTFGSGTSMMIDFSVILTILNNVIKNNETANDLDINDELNSLIAAIKSQNKKASDDKPETEE